MEALTGASIAALTLYDMCKSVTKSMEIESVYLVEKTGGKSGNYRKKDLNVFRKKLSLFRTIQKKLMSPGFLIII